MSKRDELIEKYAADLREKCGVEPNMDLLQKVTIGLGPAIYNSDSCYVAGTDPEEIATIRKNFLIKKLGLSDGPELSEGIEAAIETYGRSNPRKYRAVVYYLLARHFAKENAYS